MKCLIIDAVHSSIAEEFGKYMQVDIHMLPTQEELARLVGVRRETIGNLEKGRYNPSLVLAWNIAQVFGVSIEEIFTVEPEQQDRP